MEARASKTGVPKLELGNQRKYFAIVVVRDGCITVRVEESPCGKV
jgi:hypothetical protein